MANPEHLEILGRGIVAWNVWRGEYHKTFPDLINANLIGANLGGANLSYTRLAGVNLRYANLRYANFSGADLSGANLTGANLTGSNLSGADLGVADLGVARLTGANLSRANLRGVKFKGAYLGGVNLSNAELTDANVSEAHAGDTVFANVDLRTIVGLESINHAGASEISINTVYRSEGQIPKVFLRGCGVPEDFITYMPSLTVTVRAIDFHSCFISYCHADKAFARRLHNALQNIGIRCWLDDQQLLPGDKIYTEIDRGIRLWDKVLLCCSKESLQSWWVNHEIEIAFEKEQQLRKKKSVETLALVPLNLDGYMFSGEWRDGKATQIKSRLAADFTGWENDNKKFEEQFERLVRALRADASGREHPPVPKL